MILCMYVCMNDFMYVYALLYIRILMFICKYVCVCRFVFVCKYTVCMYVLMSVGMNICTFL